MHEFHAINEVSLFRQTYQAARLRILIDGKERLARTGRRRRAARDAGRLDRLQPLGPGPDHADRRAADGADPDQPVPAAALARRAAADTARVAHRGAGADKRPVAAVADHDEVRDVRAVDIAMDQASRSRCCSIPATAWTSASCASSSATEATGELKSSGGSAG